MSNIKAYQSETASQRSPSQNSTLGCTKFGCTKFVCLQKGHFRFWLEAVMFV